ERSSRASRCLVDRMRLAPSGRAATLSRRMPGAVLATLIVGFAAPAAAARQHTAEVLRLADAQVLEDLVQRADALWPARPENGESYRAWILEAHALLERLPEHGEMLAALRAQALPRTEEERRAEREAHPDWPRLQAVESELASRRRALLGRRDGIATELPPVDWSRYPASAPALIDIALPLVDPDRKVLGEEGLALALHASERATYSQKPAANDALAWALFALGRDQEALAASAAALAAAPE